MANPPVKPDAPEAPAYDAWGRDPRAPLGVRLAAGAIVGLLKTLYATTRTEIAQPDVHARAIASPGGTYIGVLWHRHIALISCFYPGNIPRAALVSRSRDGELLARVVARFGSRCVRGSSTSLDGRRKGGAAALLALARAAEEGLHVIVTPDGPNGPPERLKAGVIALAAMTGRTVMPLGFAASPAWRAPGWDGTVFPLPFARAALYYGEPMEVPREGASDTEPHRAELERRLLAANAGAEAFLAGEGR